MIYLYVLHGNRGNWIYRVNTLCRAALVDLITYVVKETDQQDGKDVWTAMGEAGYIEPENPAAGTDERQQEGARAIGNYWESGVAHE
jgi:hypothetical protein